MSSVLSQKRHNRRKAQEAGTMDNNTDDEVVITKKDYEELVRDNERLGEEVWALKREIDASHKEALHWKKMYDILCKSVWSRK
jgi:hypothetical protein